MYRGHREVASFIIGISDTLYPHFANWMLFCQSFAFKACGRTPFDRIGKAIIGISKFRYLVKNLKHLKPIGLPIGHAIDITVFNELG